MFRLAASAVMVVGLFAPSLPALAADTTAVLTVHNAGCGLCGPIVKGTLERIKGVTSVQVAPVKGTMDVIATVEFDNDLTTTAALIAATTNQGYPAEVKS